MKELSGSIKVGKKLRQEKDRFQAFSVQCDEPADAVRIVDQLTDEYRLKKASHLSWALRQECSNSIREIKNDGGEKGAGNCILDIMRKKNAVNTLVLVARWYGGRHLGGLRFRIYRKLTADILN
jgi:putative IMPACT (imprinted ancient) family translation regulator